MKQLESNEGFEMAFDYINQSRENVFLTGRAGTGKTTFLKHLLQNTNKQAVVTAPTGVAAINAGGVTLHSFFQLPFGPFIPEKKMVFHPSIDISNPLKLLRNARFSKEKIALIKQLDLLVIDEVSMVRADMMDAIDTILRKHGKSPHRPFGGVQMLFIGDLLQLPPVAKEEEWNLLKDYYQSPFFFDAHVFSQEKAVCIELDKIYRQTDREFIELLNKIRTNHIKEDDLHKLNEKHQPQFRPVEGESYITLCTHNYKANAINEQELKRLDGRLYEFRAKVSGQFNESAYPADESLKLKVGAQIMFIRNDKGEERRYYNGKIASISRIDDEGIYVRFPEETDEFKIERDEWENIRYSLDEEQQKVKEDKLGSFSQYPIRLAWAVTIHKSQGLTFDKAIIDAGDSFSAGQVYVALSRLTNSEGLVLYSRITADSISCDQRVVAFMNDQADKEQLQENLIHSQKKYLHEMLRDSFRFDLLLDALEEHRNASAKRKVPKPARVDKFGGDSFKALRELHQVAQNFIPKIEGYIAAGPSHYSKLLERITAAKNYFCTQMDAQLLQPLLAHKESVASWGRSKGYLQDLTDWQLAIKDKMAQIERSLILCEGIVSNTNIKAILQNIDKQKAKELEALAEIRKESAIKKKTVGETYQITLSLFQEGKDIGEIAQERGMAVSTIETHLTRLLKSGEIELQQLMEDEKINNIQKVKETTNAEGLNDIMAHLGSEYSYAEVRWVLIEMSKKAKSN